MPAVGALRTTFPSAVIGWVVEERWSALLASREARVGPRGPEKPLVDHLHIVDTRAWRTAPFSDETWREIRQVVRDLRATHYDLSLDIQGAIKSAVLGRLARPRRRFGFAQPWENMATMFYTHLVQASGTHIVERNMSLAIAAGAQTGTAALVPVAIEPAAEEWAEREIKARGMEEFAIINPGAGWGSKCWPATNYGLVAQRLGMPSLINFGPGEEKLVAEVERASGGAAKPISCSVAELVSLTRRAMLFVGGDTGPLHLAAALNTPTVALFGPTDPARNGPYGGRAVVVRSAQSVTTYKRSRAAENGLASITVDEVLAAASQVCGRNRG